MIVPFVQLTAGGDAAFCRTVALRAILASTVVVLILSVVGSPHFGELGGFLPRRCHHGGDYSLLAVLANDDEAH